MNNLSTAQTPVMESVQKLFINIWDYHSRDVPFNIFIGGRGTGKTYSGLRGAIESKEEFIFMRRLLSELTELLIDKGEDANPFQSLNADYGYDLGIEMITEKRGGIYHCKSENDVIKTFGAPIGHAVPMTSIARMKGFELKKSRYWLYDEFIKEAHVPRLKGEGDALFAAYDSICRNREFFGEPPIYMDLCSNATDIYNEIFKSLGIVADVEKMVATGVRDKIFHKRGLGVHLLASPPEFIKKREQTAIMRLTQGTRYHDMALGNCFSYNDFSLIGYQKVAGFQPICHIKQYEKGGADAYIYRKKGERRYYVSYAPAKCELFTIQHLQDVQRFQRKYGVMLRNPFTQGKLTFESYELKQIILDLIM